MRWKHRRAGGRGGDKERSLRSQKSEVRRQRSEVRGQASEVRRDLLSSGLWPLISGLWLLISGFLVFGDMGVVWAVEEGSQDTTQVDSVKVKSPMGALVRSMLVPGWGQFYNEQPRKGVLILSMELLLSGAVVYEDRQTSERQQRNTFFLWFLGVFLYNLADAYVEAHLYGFEEKEAEMVGLNHLGSEDIVWVMLVRVRF